MGELPRGTTDFDLRRELGIPGLEQDPAVYSRRVWAGALAILTAITADPGVQQALLALLPSMVPAPYIPVVSAILAAILALRSKLTDPRPVRGSDGS